MMKFSRIGLVAGISVGLLALAINAEGGPRSGKHGKGFWREKLDQKVSELGISTEQREQVRQVFMKHQPQLKPLAKKMASERAKLRDVIHAATVDEGAIRAQMVQVSQVETDLAIQRARMFAEMRPLLTSEQIAKFEQMRAGAAEKIGRWLDKAGDTGNP